MIKKPQKYTEDNSAMIGQLANVIANLGGTYYTETEVDTLLSTLKTNYNKAMHIGSGNAGYIELVPIGDDQTSRNVIFSTTYANLDATDGIWAFHFPLPLFTYDLDGNQKVLYIAVTYVGIYDADEGDEIDRIIWRAWDTYDNYDNLLNSGVGMDEDTPSLLTWNHADFEVAASYKRLFMIINAINTTAGDLEISMVGCDYYYDTPT